MNDTKAVEIIPQPQGEIGVYQKRLIDWCDGRLDEERGIIKEIQDAIDVAIRSHWGVSTLKNQKRHAENRLKYYEKMKAALEAGYMIIPNMPVQLFAVRTDRDFPKEMRSYYQFDAHEQIPEQLPVGEGDYKNPVPIVYEKPAPAPDKPDRKEYWAKAWDDKLVFPFTMAKATIIEAVNRAMALKVFDQFGILPATVKQDPIILGQLRMKNGYSEKVVSFLIAWRIDTKDL